MFKHTNRLAYVLPILLVMCAGLLAAIATPGVALAYPCEPEMSGGAAARSAEKRAATPTPAPRTYRVALQVGHYKNNELPPELSRLSGHTGAYGGGRSEVELNLEVAGRVARLLSDKGVVVEVLPATVPTGYTADAFIALHADGNSSSSARGFKISTRWRSYVARQDAMLVEMLTEDYAAATGLPEDFAVTRNMRGYYAYSPWRPNYRISHFTPGAIVEMGFMTNAADRAVMFNSTDKVAQGIADGIMRFLKTAYRPGVTPAYGYGIVDDDIDPNASVSTTQQPTQSAQPSAGQRSRVVTGDWQVLLMGKPSINAYAGPGSGQVVAKLARGQIYRSTLRNGDYYRLTLSDGKEVWVHRNATVVQMK